MHIDLEELELQAIPRSQVCIVGGGIAGIVLATRLAAAGVQVSLLEAGGLELEDRSQSLYDVEMSAERHSGAMLGRFRTFGGSSVRWGGQLLSYADDIFHPVPGSPSRGWPLDPAEIVPFYEDVLRLFEIEPLPFDDRLLASFGVTAPALPPGLRVRFSQWSPFHRRNLANTLGRECMHSPNIRLYTHANVAALEGEGGVIGSARVVDYHGRTFHFPADRFVVASGTIESSRLLLLSADAVPDPHERIGRGFSDHISLHVAELDRVATRAFVDRLGPFYKDGVLYTPKIEATSVLQRDHNLLAVMAHLIVEEPEDSGIGALRSLVTAIQRREFKNALVRQFVPTLRGLGDIVRLAWAVKVKKRRGIGRRATVRFNVDLEQSPESSNRVTLSEHTDALGLRKAVVHWTVTEQEKDTIRRFLPLLQEGLLAAGFPAFGWDETLLDGREITVADTYHPLGGLTMGTDPAASVVDPQLKVHGVENLYVASCAVYPSGGSSNPTFTLMALTMRLAEHLRALRS